MTTFYRIIIPLFLSLFIHVTIFQVQFDSDHFHPSIYSTTEIGLVLTPLWKKTASPALEGTIDQKSGNSDFVPGSEQTNKTKPRGLDVPAEGDDPPAAKKKLPAEVESSKDKIVDTSVALKPQEGESPAKTDEQSVADPAIEVNALPGYEETPPSLTVDNKSAADRAVAKEVAVSAPDDKLKLPVLKNAYPRYEDNPKPEYPDIALRRGWEGLVLLQVDVTKDGTVERVDIETSSGFTALDRAAVKAVRRWKFVPTLSGGVPVDGSAVVPIDFDLP